MIQTNQSLNSTSKPIQRRRQFRKTFLSAIFIAAALTGCLNDAVVSDPPAPSANRIDAILSDYKSGLLMSWTADSLKPVGTPLKINQDSKVFSFEDRLFILERFGANNIVQINPKTHDVIYQKKLNAEMNPVDLVFSDTHAGFIISENEPKIFRIDLDKGELGSSLDISQFIFAPDSGQGIKAKTPHAQKGILRHDTLFVALQRRNGDWEKAGGKSVILIIDAKTLTLKDTLQAQGRNASSLWLDGDALYLGCEGTPGKNESELYRWNLSTRKVSTVIKEGSAGGSFNDIACFNENQCFMTITKSDYSYGMRTFNAKTGVMGDWWTQVTDPSGGLALDFVGQRVFIGDRSPGKAGILVFDPSGKKLMGPAQGDLPPYNFHLSL